MNVWLLPDILKKNPEIAREGLSKVPRDYEVRAEIAEAISRIGEKQSDNKLKLEGYGECFYSSPSIKYLLDLYITSIECNCFEEIRENVERRIMELQGKGSVAAIDCCDGEQNMAFVSESVLFNALLLGGRYEKVFEMCQDEGQVGWSSGYNPKPVFVAFMMVILSKEGMHSKMLYTHWENAIGNTEYGMSREYIGKYHNVTAYIIKRYIKLDVEQEDFYLKWCMDEIGNTNTKRCDESYFG